MTQLTMSVWLMFRAVVMSAFPAGGGVAWNGWRREASRVDASVTADPLTSIHVDVELSCIAIARLGFM